MTFAAPWLLLGLVLLPLLAFAYAAGERRRRRAAAALAAPATRASVVPRAPGWRRHAPILLSAVAMTGLVVALARPQVSIAVPAEQASIVLAMDHSGSMQATDVAPSRLVAAREAGEAFLAKVPDKVRVGGLVFNNVAEVVQDPTTDRAALRDALRDAMVPAGGTATGDALSAALTMLDAQQGAGAKRAPGAIVLLSDGESTSGEDPLAVAQEAADRGIPVYTVALGTATGTLPDGKPVPPDTASLRAIAERSGGAAFTAQDATGLSAVYEKLGSQVAMKEEPREVTAAFAGGAIVLLLAGGALSLRWFRRLI
jgi:Ca-activated chloride channel family protein